MKIENDIRKFLIRNSIITYAVTAVMILSIVWSFMYARSVMNETKQLVYLVNTDGDVIPLRLAESQEGAIIEAKNHITLFIDYYYSLNQFNWEKKTEKALWLGDLQKDFQNKYNTGYFSSLVQFGLERYAELLPENIELIQTNEPSKVGFKIQVHITEIVGDISKRFILFAIGTVRKTDRHFPRNPHGMYIENYLEEKIIEVTK